MKSRAAVAWEAGKPLTIEGIEVAAPKQGEVLLQIAATGVCHTDAYTLSGKAYGFWCAYACAVCRFPGLQSKQDDNGSARNGR